MAIASYISFISLTYCVFILTVCQINLSSADGLSQYKTHLNPVQQQDDQSDSFNEYPRQGYPFNQQQKSSYNTAILADSKEIPNHDDESMSRLNWFKRNSRLTDKANKRMLCFFHAVNCFG